MLIPIFDLKANCINFRQKYLRQWHTDILSLSNSAKSQQWLLSSFFDSVQLVSESGCQAFKSIIGSPRSERWSVRDWLGDTKKIRVFPDFFCTKLHKARGISGIRKNQLNKHLLIIAGILRVLDSNDRIYVVNEIEKSSQIKNYIPRTALAFKLLADKSEL